jgi:hypothetical protein
MGIVIKQLPTKKGAGEKATAQDFAERAENLEGTCVMGDAMPRSLFPDLCFSDL